MLIREHNLKILPYYFKAVTQGIKKAELRRSDRDFQAGDILILAEWEDLYTGREVNALITHVADVSEYAQGYVLLSFELMAPLSEAGGAK
ncbi:hypothetical protein A8A01_15390 [Ewingella americana]|nr:hypothetical protein A8A01_15390 [Ewingella americana]